MRKAAASGNKDSEVVKVNILTWVYAFLILIWCSGGNGGSTTMARQPHTVHLWSKIRKVLRNKDLHIAISCFNACYEFPFVYFQSISKL